jgi:hypothetical protein
MTVDAGILLMTETQNRHKTMWSELQETNKGFQTITLVASRYLQFFLKRGGCEAYTGVWHKIAIN